MERSRKENEKVSYLVTISIKKADHFGGPSHFNQCGRRQTWMKPASDQIDGHGVALDSTTPSGAVEVMDLCMHLQASDAE